MRPTRVTGKGIHSTLDYIFSDCKVGTLHAIENRSNSDHIPLKTEINIMVENLE